MGMFCCQGRRERPPALRVSHPDPAITRKMCLLQAFSSRRSRDAPVPSRARILLGRDKGGSAPHRPLSARRQRPTTPLFPAILEGPARPARRPLKYALASACERPHTSAPPGLRVVEDAFAFDTAAVV
jgi:hypothetical protein